MTTIPGYVLTAPVCESGDLLLYRATRTQDGLPVVLKFAASPRPSPLLLVRLEREYELTRDLVDCSRIARPLALERPTGNVLMGLVLVLEDGPTRTLASLLDSPMEVPAFLEIAIGAAAALAELHRHDLVHKDIKPEHVLLDADGHVWLTGLGIASRLPREHQAPESPETIAGTLAYMAPEQTGRMNRSIDSRSDLYALGVTFYQMLTGQLPFSAFDPMGWVHCHIALEPQPPSQCRAAIPQSLSEMVMKMMAKGAEDRYQSAAGLLADLERCAAEWREQGRISSFSLAARDIPDRLVIPEKLYGREREVAKLLDAFHRIQASGKPELVLISGYSGVGKTAVVHELHKALVPPRGLFASGKFDRYKRDTPYATLVQALQILIRQILGRTEAEVAAWREAIQQAVTPNGQLIVSLIPEVELILGKQPPAPALPPQEARNRFQMVLRRFLGAFAGPEHPLVLFLDDLQWLDAATLDLIESLATGEEVRHLLLIGAYRDNEVGPAHPLMRIVEAIHKAGTGLGEIVLAPLGLGDVGGLVAAALHCDREHVLPLAQLVYEKTGGNPFFVIQFLTALAEEKLLVFDPGAGLWTWDMAGIHAKGYTDNVIDLMAGKLNRLPAETLQALEHLACLGNVAEITTLTAVCSQAEKELHGALWEAVRSGLVFRQEKTYTFLHDRVQEAAYALVPEDRRNALHLDIGRLLFAQYPQEAMAERVFEVTDQFNRGIELVTGTQERETLRRLNAVAGRKARSAVAYASGRRYLERAIALLPPSPWNDNYAETLTLYRDLAECEYLAGNFSRADELLTAALEKAHSTVDLASIHRLRLRLYQISGRYREALEVALEALRLFGVTLPEADEDIQEATEAEHRQVVAHVGGRRIIDLLNLPAARDAETKALLGLMADSAATLVLLRSASWPLFLTKAINICLQRGHCKESAFLYSFYAAALIEDIRKIKTALQFCDLAVELDALSPAASLWRGRILLQQSIVTFWGKHFSVCLPLMEQAFRSNLDFGDFAWGGYTSYHAIWAHLENGDPLPRVTEVARRYVAWAHDIRSGVIYEVTRLEEQFALSLQGKTRSLTDFSDSAFDEARSFAVLEEANFVTFYYVMKQMAAFIGEQHDEALKWADRVASLRNYLKGQVNAASDCFYRALTMAALYAQAPAGQQLQFAEAIGEMQEELKNWADSCPENFANRYFLVSAEIARIEGREMEAMRLYDEAIRSAHENNFVHQEAIAAEVASRFYRARGFDRIADAYLRDAHANYGRWGAQGKVRQMEQRHPQLREAPTLASALASGATFRAGVQDLDILAAVRASQAVSGEIRLDNLLKTLMRIVLENAGARQSHLLLVQNGELTPAASACVENQNVAVHLHGDAEFPESRLPTSILNYVRRSLDKVLIEDATAPHPYSADEYFSRRHPKSVLCIPIVRQSGLTGLLYLENDLVTHAFTPERLAVLELLATQAAISLENALGYEVLRRVNRELRAISACNQVLVRATDEQELLDKICGIVCEKAGYRMAWVGYIENDEAKTVRPVVSAGVDAGYLETAHIVWADTDRGRGPTGASIRSGRTATAQDYATAPHIAPWREMAQERGFRSCIALPLKDESGAVFGAFTIYSTEPNAFPPEEVRLLEELAGEMAYGIAVLRSRHERNRAEDEIRRLNAELEERVRQRTAQLEAANKELESFGYTVSHDLRAPLRHISAFSKMLEEEFREQMPAEARKYLDRVETSAQRMGTLIDGLLKFSRMGRQEMRYRDVALEQMVKDVVEELSPEWTNRPMEWKIGALPTVQGEPVLLRQVFQNLIANALKFSRHRTPAIIEIGAISQNGTQLLFVRDNGAGFDMKYAGKLFGVFQRLHRAEEFEGTGIGLATVQRIVQRHNGKIWAEAEVDHGAAFYFTLEGLQAKTDR